MSDVKSLTRSFGDTKSVELDEERMLRVIATAPTLDRDLDVLDSKTARIPIKPKGWKYAQDLTLDDDVDIPFLVDHDQWNGIQKQAGSVKKMYINEDGELEAIVKLSTVEMGEHVYTLAKEGHLGNSFSIGFSLMNATEDEEGLKNYEITELSAVFKGSNRDSRLVEVKSIKKQEVSELDAKKAQAAKLLKEIAEAEVVKTEMPIVEEAEVQTDAEVIEEKQTPVTEAGSNTEEVTVKKLTDEQKAEATKSIKTNLAKVKGIVADVANADGSWEAEDDKWDALEPVRDLFYALQEAYYFTPTKVEDFDVLLAEFSELVAALARKDSDVKMSDELTKAFDGKTLEDVKQVVDTIVGTKTETAVTEAVVEKQTDPIEEAKEEVAPVVAEPVAEEEVETVEDVPAPEAEKTKTGKETKKETKMTDAKDIAQKMVIAPADQAVVDTKAVASNYLESREAVKDFAQVLRKTAGMDAGAVKKAWAAQLEAKGITNPEVLLPTPVISRISGLLETEGKIWSRVFKTGAKAFRVAMDTNTGDTSRAGGHTPGVDKAEEVITLAPRLIRSQFIYKYLTLDRSTEFEDDGALLDYVATELPRRIIAEIERAIVIGDGRAPSDDRKITEIKSIREDAVSGAGYASRFTAVTGLTPFQKLVRGSQEIETDGNRLLVATRAFIADLTLQENANGGLVFAPGTNLAALLGYEDIVTPRWMDADTENDAYVFVPQSYYTVGQNSVEAFTNFLLKSNTYEYLQEIAVGGALVDPISGVAIAKDGAS